MVSTQTLKIRFIQFNNNYPTVSAVGFFLLLSPLVELYVGADRVLATSIIAWYLTDYFFKGERVVLSNFKTAAGVFEFV